MGRCEDIYREHTELIEQAAQAAGTTEPDASWLGVISTEFGRGNINAATFGDMNTFRANGCSIPPEGISRGASVSIDSVTAQSNEPRSMSVTAVLSLPQSAAESVTVSVEGRLGGELNEVVEATVAPGSTTTAEWELTGVEPGEQEFCVEVIDN